MRRRVATGATVVVALLAIGAGCASPREASDARGGVAGGASAAPLRDSTVPAQLLDLTSTPEDVSKLVKKAGHDTFVTSTRLWSLRSGDRLRATLEISRLAPDARPEEESFRTSIVDKINTSGPIRWINGREVYVRKGNQQSYVWFRGLHFFILSVSAEYPSPRSLLRAAMEITP